MFNQTSDNECNGNWDALLRVFHKIVESKPKDAKEQFVTLKDTAKNMAALSPRQREGIIDRCDYQIQLIDNPSEKHFSNMYRKEDRTLQLNATQSNGKH